MFIIENDSNSKIEFLKEQKVSSSSWNCDLLNSLVNVFVDWNDSKFVGLS